MVYLLKEQKGERLMFSNTNLKKLNALEMDIYEYVIAHKDEISSLRIRELAKLVNVSTTSILRFCNKLDCAGFTEFKIKFKMALEESEHRNIQTDINLTIANLERMAVSDIDQKIAEAVTLIADSSHIVFLGLGSSGILCKYAVRFLFSFGIVSSYVDDPYFPHNIKFEEGTSFIIISVSGETPDVLGFIHNFKRHKGKLVSVTNYGNNTISQLSDVNIPYYVNPEFIGISNITTQLPVIYILETLAKQLYNLKQA